MGRERGNRRALGVALALVLGSGVARADDASSADLAAARALAIEGLRLASAHKCEEAIDRLTRAERIHHAPTTLGRLAECQIELGRLVAGTENLQRLLHEPLPPKSPPAFVFARSRAERQLSATLPKIAKLTIMVAPANARVTLDGEVFAPALVGLGQAADPGEHVVEASAAGFDHVQSKVTLEPGEAREITLDLTREASPEPNGAPPAIAPPVPVPLSPLAPAHASSAGTWTAFGIGAVGIGAAVVLGVLYASKRSDFDARCPTGACPAGAGVSEEDVTTYRAAAAGALVIGATSIVVGIVLFATGGGQPLSPTAAAAPVLRF